MTSPLLNRFLKLVGFLLTALGAGLGAGFFGNISRETFCYYGGESDTSLSKIWCQYIDWDFRIDLPLFFVMGLVGGAIYFIFNLRKQELSALYIKIAILWGSAVVLMCVIFVLGQLGVRYQG